MSEVHAARAYFVYAFAGYPYVGASGKSSRKACQAHISAALPLSDGQIDWRVDECRVNGVRAITHAEKQKIEHWLKTTNHAAHCFYIDRGLRHGR